MVKFWSCCPDRGLSRKPKQAFGSRIEGETMIQVNYTSNQAHPLAGKDLTFEIKLMKIQ